MKAFKWVRSTRKGHTSFVRKSFGRKTVGRKTIKRTVDSLVDQSQDCFNCCRTNASWPNDVIMVVPAKLCKYFKMTVVQMTWHSCINKTACGPNVCQPNDMVKAVVQNSISVSQSNARWPNDKVIAMAVKNCVNQMPVVQMTWQSCINKTACGPNVCQPNDMVKTVVQNSISVKCQVTKWHRVIAWLTKQVVSQIPVDKMTRSYSFGSQKLCQ